MRSLAALLIAIILALLQSGEIAAQEKLKGELEAQKAKNAAQEAEIAALKENAESFEMRLAALEEGEEDFSFESFEEEEEQPLEVSGFFDLTFQKYWFNEGSSLGGRLPQASSFILPRMNFYFYGNISESIHTLVELRFSFFPHGRVINVENPMSGLSFNREDMAISDNHTGEKYTLGGVLIERAQLVWQPSDHFGILAGRFLTPFGIWNVDHGTPILLPIYYPVIQNNHAVPLKQTGLQVFGRFSPLTDTSFEYAVTLSNGRGPMEEVYDLDENKAVGLRLRLSYEGPKATLALGGYGFYGKYTDTKLSLIGLGYEESTTESYNELLGSLDLLVEFVGIRLQAEYVRSLIRYEERPFLTFDDPPHGMGYPADYTKTFFYVLLGYTLPLEKWLGVATITPYLLYEFNEENDAAPTYMTLAVYSAGITVKPIPAIALKVQYAAIVMSHLYTDPKTKNNHDGFQGLSAQVAVSF